MLVTASLSMVRQVKSSVSLWDASHSTVLVTASISMVRQVKSSVSLWDASHSTVLVTASISMVRQVKSSVSLWDASHSTVLVTASLSMVRQVNKLCVTLGCQRQYRPCDCLTLHRQTGGSDFVGTTVFIYGPFALLGSETPSLASLH